VIDKRIVHVNITTPSLHQFILKRYVVPNTEAVGHARTMFWYQPFVETHLMI